MKLDQLPKIVKHSKKRLGQGYGSGKGGHTVGKGQKGQNTRGNMAVWFEGGQLPQIRRFPFIRGKSRFDPLKQDTLIISLTQLNSLKPNSRIDLKTLIDHNIVSDKDIKLKSIKIVANGSINIPLTLTLPATKSAEDKIIAAGGQVEREQHQ